METSRRKEARRCLETGNFPANAYKIVDPWESSYRPGMMDSPRAGMHGQQTQTELCPGNKIYNCNLIFNENKNTYEQKCFLFSGSVINPKQGLTVAHAIDPGNEIEIKCDSDSAAEAHKVIVGRCRETFLSLQRQSGGQLSADLALLELDTDRCSVHNTVWWPYRGANTAFQIKIYKGHTIPDDTGVIILDRNGEFQSGCIRRTRVNDGNLHDAIGICASEEEEVTVTQPGDSGALVMSIPKSDKTLYVYGIVTGISGPPDGEPSFTVANSLWKVIDEISTNENYSAALAGDTRDIDFA